jgi:hypothetical protein
MNVQTLAHVPTLQFGKILIGVCPSSRLCLSRVLFWAVVNLGTIAPVMT